MIDNPPCEVCGSDDWQVIGQRTYRPLKAGRRTTYLQRRYKVLFDLWFSDQQTVTLTSVLCPKCGLIVYRPRPEASDIDDKYALLESLGQDYGQNPPESRHEVERADDIYRYIQQRVDFDRVCEVLDYGGGDGRLMQPFHAAGRQCYLVDYNRNAVPGVTKLADTVEQLNGALKFDLIVCSHVLEHVAQPMQTLRKLSSVLKPGGTIYVEVPMEVWRRAPLHIDPVTHINFFTPSSMRNLFLFSGLDIIDCRLASCPHPSGIARHGIRAVGRVLSEPVTDTQDRLVAPDAMDFLHPTIGQMVNYHRLNPGVFPRRVLRRIQRIGRQS